VNIFGSVNKHTFPTGFGPGVTAVFHRILYARYALDYPKRNNWKPVFVSLHC